MHVAIFDWDEEEFDRGNTRHILSAGYEPDAIEEAIRGYLGPVGSARRSGRAMIVVEIDGEPTRIIFEVDADDHLIIVTPLTAFPAEG